MFIITLHLNSGFPVLFELVAKVLPCIPSCLLHPWFSPFCTLAFRPTFSLLDRCLSAFQRYLRKLANNHITIIRPSSAVNWKSNICLCWMTWCLCLIDDVWDFGLLARKIWNHQSLKTLTKAQRTKGLPAVTKRTAFKSGQMLVKILASKSWPNFSFKILTKSKPQRFNQKCTSKSWTNFTFNIVTKTKVQNIYQNSASKSRPNCRQHVPQHQHQQH